MDSVKITPFGHYMRHTLAGMFSYLDLVSVDSAIHEEGVAHSIARKASEELAMFFRGVKVERVELRLSRVEEFIDYLNREAAVEAEYYSLDPSDVRYAAELRVLFDRERERVRASAQRYARRQGESPERMTFTIGDSWE